jgi:hypothetical protein
MSHGGHRLSNKGKVLSPAGSSGVREFTPSVECRGLTFSEGPMICTKSAVLKAFPTCVPGDAQGATHSISSHHGGDPAVAMGSETALERTVCASGVLPANLGARFGLRTCLPASRWAASAAGSISLAGVAALEALAAGALATGARSEGVAARPARGMWRRARSNGTLVTVGSHIKLFWASIIERPTQNTGGSTQSVWAVSSCATSQLRHISWMWNVTREGPSRQP